DEHAPVGERLGELPDERRLADARLAAHEDDSTRAEGGSVPRLRECRQCFVAFEELHRSDDREPRAAKCGSEPKIGTARAKDGQPPRCVPRRLRPTVGHVMHVHPEILSELARQKQADLIAEARASRAVSGRSLPWSRIAGWLTSFANKEGRDGPVRDS